MRRTGRWAMLAAWCCLAGARAQTVASWHAVVQPNPAKAGDSATLVLVCSINPGWHIYAAKGGGDYVATSFKFNDDSFKALGGLAEPTPHKELDETTKAELLTHAGTVTFRQKFRVPAKSGAFKIDGTVEYQACNDKSCLPPTSASVHATIMIADAGAGAKTKEEPGKSDKSAAAKAKADQEAAAKAKAAKEAAAKPKPEATQPAPTTAPPVVPVKPEPAVKSDVKPLVTTSPAPAPTGASKPTQAPTAPASSAADQARSRGLGAFLLVAFLAGLAALLTPCVFPMVPITVSFFTKQAGDHPRKRVLLALSYGLGIVLTYTGLGLLLALVQGPAGGQAIAASPWFNLAFAALFIFFALSLFGYFELGLPSGLVNRTSRLGSAGGYFGALFMGLTLTLAAFTCTVQFVGGVLVWAANGEWLWPILGMLSFSTAFATPFVLLALFPQWLASLPKSGGWLHHTKVVLGFVEVAAAFKFVSNADLVWQWRVFTRELVLAAWAGTFYLAAVYLLGRLKLADSETEASVGRGRRVLAGLCGVLTLYFAWGLTGARLESNLESLLPPADYGRGAHSGGNALWLEDYEQGLAQAKARGQLAFVDFSGVTCTNCRLMEANMFPKPEIASRLNKLTLVRLLTDQGPKALAYRKLQVEHYKTATLPFYAIVKPDGTTVATFDGMTRDVAAFARFLDGGLGAR